MRLVLEMVDKVATMGLRDMSPGTEGKTSYLIRTMTMAAMLVSDRSIEATSHTHVSPSRSRVRLMNGHLGTELGCEFGNALAGDGFSCS